MFNLRKINFLRTKSPLEYFTSDFSLNLEKYKFIEISKENHIFKITINKVETLNSLCFQTLREISDAVRTANECNDTKYTVVTGKGKYFSSGMDLKQYLDWKTKGIIENKESIKEDLAEFVNCFLYHDKILIGVYNGPAVGGATSMVPWFDYTIVSEDAFFRLPFVRFGLTPTDLASYYFPEIIGKVQSNEMLLLQKTLTAKEACKRNLINEVVKKEDLWKVFTQRINQFNNFDIENLKAIKKFVKYDDRQKLENWSAREIESFVERLCRPEFYENILKIQKK